VSTRFLLIRHAESAWNATRRWQGHADPPLSARGVAQAESLARSLAGEPADRLLCSDLARARHTAEIVGRALGLDACCDARLRELDVGAWEGLTREEITARDPEALARFDAGLAEQPAGGAESRADLRRRVLQTFRALAEAHPEECLVVVTHLGVLQALLSGGEVANAGIARIVADEIP
jgi:broad specificity phosphatase PhoE